MECLLVLIWAWFIFFTHNMSSKDKTTALLYLFVQLRDRGSTIPSTCILGPDMCWIIIVIEAGITVAVFYLIILSSHVHPV